jgi:hypothetical protein
MLSVAFSAAGTVRGMVRATDGRPAVHAWVQGLVWSNDSGKPMITEQSAIATTNEEGRFVLGSLPLGAVEVVAAAHRWTVGWPAPAFVRLDVQVAGESDRRSLWCWSLLETSPYYASRNARSPIADGHASVTLLNHPHHDAKARIAAEHALVGFGDAFHREDLVHRTHPLEHAERVQLTLRR